MAGTRLGLSGLQYIGGLLTAAVGKLTGTGAKVAVGVGAASAGAFGVATLDEAIRGGDSVLSRAQQNVAEANAAEQAAGAMAGWKEGLANILNTIASLFPSTASFLQPWEANLRQNIRRTPQQQNLLDATIESIGKDPSALAIYGIGAAIPGLGATVIAHRLMSGVATAANAANATRTAAAGITATSPGIFGTIRNFFSGTPAASTATGLVDDAARAGGFFSRIGQGLSKLGGPFRMLGIATVAGATVMSVAGSGEAQAATTDGSVTTPTASLSNEVAAGGLSILGARTAVQAAAPAAASIGLKGIPGLGAIFAAGEAIYETAGYALNGEFAKAGTRLVAGVGETVAGVGGIVTYGTLGTAWREAVRAGGAAIFGQENAIEHSHVVNLGSWLYNSFTGATNPTTADASVERPAYRPAAYAPSLY